MSWVNLDDVYVNKSGDAIAGDLSVGGALTVNDGKGTDTTYNVANEITTLRDSVSPIAIDCNITIVPTTVIKIGNIVVVTVCGITKQKINNWDTVVLSKDMPKGIQRANAMLMSQDTTDNRTLLSVVPSRQLLIESKGCAIPNGSWVFGQLIYVCE